ncbi:MAG: RNA polymerase sigma factor [Acidimicrobiia bacterium]|nr:RNA polymerase sigma factor [Acidimicrobiia bacterium]
MASKPSRADSPGSGGSEEQGELSLLMERYQDAEAEAAEELVGRVSPILFRFFLSYTHDVGRAEDLLQDCWVRIHRARHSFRRGEPLMPWVFAIARHTRLDALRKRIRRKSREALMDSIPEGLHTTEQPRLAPRENFENMLAELPDSQREVIIMLKVSGMTLEEVARATSCTVGSVKQKAHRAYAKLRRILNDRKDDSE